MKASVRDFLKRSDIARYLVRRYRARARLPKLSNLLGKDRAVWQKLTGSAQSEQHVLFATSSGGNLAALALDTILVIALTLRKVKVTVLLCDGVLPACLLCTIDQYGDDHRFARRGPQAGDCRDCFLLAKRLYARLGIAVVTYSDFLDAATRREFEQISRELPLDDIARYRHENVAVGEHAFAGALRFYAKAVLDDRHAEQVLRRYLHASLLTAQVVQRLLRQHPVDCAVFDHGIYVPNGVIGEVARRDGVRVVNWHVAYRKQCFIFSHGDTYHHTLMSEPTQNWEQMPWSAQLEAQIMEYLHSRWWGSNDWISFNRNGEADTRAIAAELGIDFSKPTIGMLTNVMWDAQLHYPANAFKNMLEWVLATIEYFSNRPDLQLLIRVHPAEYTGTLPSRQPIIAEIRKAFPRLAANIFIVAPQSKLNTYALMERCNAAIIYGTKTGVELTSIGIPTIVAGEAWIRNKGVTLDVSNKEQYTAILDRLPLAARLDPQTVQRARKYAYHFFFRRMIPLRCVRAIDATPPFEANSSGLAALVPGHDAGLDVICDGILKGTEFIFPAEAALVPSCTTPLTAG